MAMQFCPVDGSLLSIMVKKDTDEMFLKCHTCPYSKSTNGLGKSLPEIISG